MVESVPSDPAARATWKRRLKTLGKVGLVLVILNEIRGAAVVAGVLMAWKPWERF